MVVDWPQNHLHGKRVRIDHIDLECDIAHPNCAERMLVEMIFVHHPSLPEPVGIGAERLAGTAANARLREADAEDGGAQGELLI